MNKAEKIRELYAQGLSTREIAGIVGCRTEYVRVVARQRVNGSSHIERRYLCRRYGTEDIAEAWRRRSAEARTYDYVREADRVRERRRRARMRAEMSA